MRWQSPSVCLGLPFVRAFGFLAFVVLEDLLTAEKREESASRQAGRQAGSQAGEIERV
jgi:hypothetical protein